MNSLFKFIFFFFSFSVCVSAGTIRVPQDQPTIQAGINAAMNGDLVLVANGTYTGDGNRDIDFNGKAITVRSENGAESCIIDCEGDGCGFSFHSSEGEYSVVQGFMIRNGYSNAGAGILCNGSSPRITNNIISGNETWGPYAYGGGIYLGDSNAVVMNNKISNNFAYMGGGGILCSGSPVIANNIITGNRCWGNGGGGIYVVAFDNTVITNNIISENGAEDGTPGGGILIVVGSVIITNSIFWGNGADYGGGIEDWGGSTVMNCILWGNYPDQISGSTVTYSDVEGGYPGAGNINADPLFVSGPLGDYYLSQIAAGQSQDSPCVDAGDAPIQWPCLPHTVCGTTRTDIAPDTDIIDMGFHYPLLGIQIPPGHSLEKIPLNGSDLRPSQTNTSN